MTERRLKCPADSEAHAPDVVTPTLIKSEGSSMQRAELTVQRGTGPRTCQISDPEDGRTVALGWITRMQGCSGEVPVHAVLPCPRGKLQTYLCPAWQRARVW